MTVDSKSGLSKSDKELLATHGYTMNIGKTHLIEAAQIVGTNTFISFVRRNENFYVFKSDGNETVEIEERESRKEASELFQKFKNDAEDRGESLKPVF